MNKVIPKEIITQVSQALEVIERNLESALVAVHLYGSALDGGLKPYSDIDLLVTVSGPLCEKSRHMLLNELLTVSCPPGDSKVYRALEVTIVVLSEVVPWHYPPKRELQFGEWLRNDILAGTYEPAVIDPDLTILITKVRQHGLALMGPSSEDLFATIPDVDMVRALTATLDLWHSSADWAGDERHVLLTLARIWYSAATGEIAPKSVAADWVMEYLPLKYRSVLQEAKQAYLGGEGDLIATRVDDVAESILFMKHHILKLLDDGTRK
ncbi:MAG TPA: AadA family aminoglycoside 3''-O-nucleotidyltransferase [Cellvibrio sp.]|nr:AadA family aminoglycoside 3''-O-nucleotidyltransferase [Cellvibrio sp.]